MMTYSNAKVQVQRSVGSEDKVETNGRTDRQTDGGDCITSLANAVGNNCHWLCGVDNEDGADDWSWAINYTKNMDVTKTSLLCCAR